MNNSHHEGRKKFNQRTSNVTDTSSVEVKA
jgi:hypothetical protein